MQSRPGRALLPPRPWLFTLSLSVISGVNTLLLLDAALDILSVSVVSARWRPGW